MFIAKQTGSTFLACDILWCVTNFIAKCLSLAVKAVLGWRGVALTFVPLRNAIEDPVYTSCAHLHKFIIPSAIGLIVAILPQLQYFANVCQLLKSMLLLMPQYKVRLLAVNTFELHNCHLYIEIHVKYN